MVRNPIARTGPPPNDGDITDDWVGDGWDIDRWENDGGKSLGYRDLYKKK